MSEEFDFERNWLNKFSNSLDRVLGASKRDQVMQDSQDLSMESARMQVIAWSRLAMQRLDAVADESQRHEIMTGCACQYPPENLIGVRDLYQQTGDLDVAHQMLQDIFENFLREDLQLEQSLIDEIINRGWGLAGVRRGNTIIATKIPKSGNLRAYWNERDPEVKRAAYCHCPRVRALLQPQQRTVEPISSTYCYCGAGFYKGIWETILNRPVKVQVLESVLQGDEVCKIAIHLPLD